MFRRNIAGTLIQSGNRYFRPFGQHQLPSEHRGKSAIADAAFLAKGRLLDIEQKTTLKNLK
ncbi:MAG: hypothetical protein LBF88_06725 [Planctomycetaceae bacterium]|jgi:hypothetical protein|nr:hypothetical protein [Planctomycetaceae bacterium]